MAKRKTLTYEEKVKVIEAVETGNRKKSDIAKEFGIPANTLSTIIKNKAKYENQSSLSKRIKGPEFKDVDECVLQWFRKCRDTNLPISGPLIQEKATEFAAKLGKPNFRASNGWLQNFKRRNEVGFKKITGESADVDDNVCTEWTEKLSDLTRGYTPEDIFNADETGLYYQCLPDKTLAFKGDSCHGGKNSKNRVKLLLGANQTGTIKLKPLLIGKSKNPRCFKGVQSFPMDYTSNPKSWMKSEIFANWLTNVDKEMIKKKKKILMFIDNCTAHGDVPKLKNVKVEFLPPNTTSKLQPLDQGVIKNFKVLYRKEVVRQFLHDLEDKNPTKISVLDAMWMASKAWNNVTAKTIENCFLKSGFKRQNQDDEGEDVDCSVAGTSTDDAIRPEQWAQITTSLDIEGITFEEFVSFDDDLAVCGQLTDTDIIASVSKPEEEEDDANDSDDGVAEAPDPVPSLRDARCAISTVQKFLQQKTVMSDQVVQSIAILDNAIDKVTLTGKQTTIRDFFNSRPAE